MPNTATLVLDGAGGHSAPARVWRLDPPLPSGAEHVCTWIENGTRHQAAKILVVQSNERGNALGWSVREVGGSYTLHPDYDGSPEYVDGAHWLALQLLGAYNVVPNLDKEE